MRPNELTPIVSIEIASKRWKEAQKTPVSPSITVAQQMVIYGKDQLKAIYQQNPELKGGQIAENWCILFVGTLAKHIENSFWDRSGWSSTLFIEDLNFQLSGIPIPKLNWQEFLSKVSDEQKGLYSDSVTTHVIRKYVEEQRRIGFFFDNPRQLGLIKPIKLILENFPPGGIIEAGKIFNICEKKIKPNKSQEVKYA